MEALATMPGSTFLYGPDRLPVDPALKKWKPGMLTASHSCTLPGQLVVGPSFRT